jgi:hypothetical protein
MAYDGRRKVVVLFGGLSRSGPGYVTDFSGQTWEWDGTAWALRSSAGPSPRAGHAMAYDAARGVVVLFGGGDALALNSQTWEWDGAAWMQRSSTMSPPARVFSVMAYDSRRQVTVLFGGEDYGNPQTFFNDTWQWDGQEWIRRAVGGPAARAFGAMAYDSDRDRLVLYGGHANALVPLADTWLGRVPVAGDANRDDEVDVSDLLIVAQQFGLHQGDAGFDSCADFDTSGLVDVLDLLKVVNRWGWRVADQSE